MLRSSLLFFICFCCTLSVSAQFDLMEVQLELKTMREKIMKSRDDAEKIEMNRNFGLQILEIAEDPSTFFSKLDSIPKIGVIYSPDKDLKIINWNLALENQSFMYYAVLIQKHKSKIKVTQLQDKSTNMKKPLEAELNAQSWFGSLYYDILPFKHQGSKHYLLLGWDGEDAFSNKKIIDVLHFEDGLARFGALVFDEPYAKRQRVIFQYSAKSVMSLAYNEKLKMVVFDHLSPMQDNLEGMHEFYVPDMSYDGLRYKGGLWRLEEDVDVRSNRSMKNYTAPPQIGR